MITRIAEQFAAHGIKSYYVGGCVRDSLLGIPTDDIDICLVGVTDKTVVETVLRANAEVVISEVGSQFPVWIVQMFGQKYDFALARGEKKVGALRTDFICTTDGVTIEEDLQRRDLTINAIAQEILTGIIVDPYWGSLDIAQSIARPVGEAFAEDTLRVLRAARFIARFELYPAPELISMCKGLKPTDISNERVGMELMKLFKQAKRPSLFFAFLKEVGWLQYHFEELAALIGVQQDPNWHPEGDAFEHTLYTIDACNQGDWFTRTVMMCHDLGKATCTKWEDDRWRAKGHEEAGVPLTDTLLKRIHFTDHKTIGQIKLLLALHMIPAQDISAGLVRKTMRQLYYAHLDYSQLVEVCRCDKSGRPPLPPVTPYIGQDIAQIELERGFLIPIVTGKLLQANGYTNNLDWGTIIARALELQDRGSLTENNWAKKVHNIQKEIENARNSNSTGSGEVLE